VPCSFFCGSNSQSPDPVDPSELIRWRYKDREGTVGAGGKDPDNIPTPAQTPSSPFTASRAAHPPPPFPPHSRQASLPAVPLPMGLPPPHPPPPPGFPRYANATLRITLLVPSIVITIAGRVNYEATMTHFACLSWQGCGLCHQTHAARLVSNDGMGCAVDVASSVCPASLPGLLLCLGIPLASLGNSFSPGPVVRQALFVGIATEPTPARGPLCGHRGKLPVRPWGTTSSAGTSLWTSARRCGCTGCEMHMALMVFDGARWPSILLPVGPFTCGATSC
jgi:hypothetical protein